MFASTLLLREKQTSARALQGTRIVKVAGNTLE